MEQQVAAGQPSVHIILACEADHILGGIVFEEFHGTGCWLATYLAVRPQAHRRGIAHALIQAAIGDILQTCDGDWILFSEAENPARISDPVERAHGEQRLQILNKLALKCLSLAYVQPALAVGKRPLDDLLLLCWAPDPWTDWLNAANVSLFLTAYYAALGQSNSAHLQQMCATLAATNVVKIGCP
jgi:GNAT superfamily N-acetyltransferase